MSNTIKRLIASSVLVICIVFSIASIMNNLNIDAPNDESLLTALPCRFPCWHNLIPGQSTMSEVQVILGSDSFITTAKQTDQGIDGADRTVFRWWHNNPQQQNRILMAGNLIYSIEVYPNISFTVEDVISRYGQPDAVSARLERSNEGGHVDATLFFYYAQLGLEIEFRILGGNVLITTEFGIEPSTPGLRFRLFSPQANYRALISEIYQLQGEELNHFIEKGTFAWTNSNSVILVNPNHQSFYDQTFIVTATPVTP